MSDTTRDTTERDTARQCATITDAARILRVSVRTVQRRLDSGALKSIERDGKRLVQLPTNATERATPDATERDTAQAGSTPDLAAQLAQSREEVLFLRGLVEQRDRDAAELRAALRKSLDAMPKAIEAAAIEAAADVSRETNAALIIESAPAATGAPETESRKPATRKRAMRPHQRVLARLFGLPTTGGKE